MNRLKLVSTVAFLSLACASSAFAGAGEITTTVTPLQANVSYAQGTALVTYIGYEITVANTGGNTINTVRFTGTIAMTDAAEKATYFSTEGATCVTTVNPGTSINDATSIECTIGQLSAGQSSPKFAVFFKAPAKAVNGVADDVTPDFAKDHASFAGKTYYAEGASGQNPAPNSIADWTTDSVLLGTFNPENVKSAVPKLGADQYQVFTGDQAISKATDRYTTLVRIPAVDAYTTAEINETVFDAVNCSSFLVCSQSQLKIPLPAGQTAFKPYLTIVLRQDKENIRAGTKIGSVLIDYIDDAGTVYKNIGQCASGDVPDSRGIPCISVVTPPKHYKNRSVEGWTPALDDDFEWTLVAPHNGFIRFPN